MKKVLTIVSSIATAVFGIYLGVLYIYSQKFVQDSPNTATQGIIFKKTLKLDKYDNVASCNSIWGRYDRYSRSDRHSEVITVYCKEYCRE